MIALGFIPDPQENPAEGDLITIDHMNFWEEGGIKKGPVVQVAEGEPWEPHVRAWMEKEGFYPNVWFLSDHGNPHKLSLD